MRLYHKYFRKFAADVNNPKKIQGPIFVLALFAVAAMIFSQTAIFMALKGRM